MNNSHQWTPEKWQEATTAIMRRAATDVAFRKRALSDPRGVIKEVSGLDMHPNARIRFAEPQEGLILTLPPLRIDSELTDSELESVSGGGGWQPWFFNVSTG